MDGAIEVSGVFLRSFGLACLNLKILVGEEAGTLAELAPDEFYPAERFTAVLDRLAKRYTDFAPIKEQIGIAMMKLWYDYGPGRSIVKRGADFLRHQTGSEGYHSVVRGAGVGDFSLAAIDEAAGKARVKSSTPFDRTMERGILLGGMRLPGDLVYLDVDNAADPDVFEITFH